MSETTNIAQDVAELFERLSSGGDAGQGGAKYLAEKFQVKEWSREFFEVVTIILETIDQLQEIIEQVVVREQIKSRALNHLATMRLAFDHTALTQQWKQMGQNRTGSARTDPILSLGESLKAFDYEKPTAEEIEEFRTNAVELLEWLQSHPLEDRDFIRACLIDGVSKFLFRLDKFQWVGWGYAAESLRDIVNAYMVLANGLDAKQKPKTAATLKKIGAHVAKPLALITKGRELKEDFEFLLAVYRGSAPFVNPALGYVAGYLTSGH